MSRAEQGRRGRLFYSLLVLLVGIWGGVLYQVRRGPVEPAPAAPRSAPVPAPDSAGRVRRIVPVAAYTGGFRDPFVPPAALYHPARAPDSLAGSPAIPPAPAGEAPPLRLSGIVGGTALLQGETLHFARAGEVVEGVHIRSVEADHVVAEFAGTPDTLRLHP